MRNPRITHVVLVPGDSPSQGLAVAAVAELVAAGAVQHEYDTATLRSLPEGCVAVGVPCQQFVCLAQCGIPVIGVLDNGVTGPAALLSLCGGFLHEGADPHSVLRVAAHARCPSWRVLAACVAATRTATAPAA